MHPTTVPADHEFSKSFATTHPHETACEVRSTYTARAGTARGILLASRVLLILGTLAVAAGWAMWAAL